ncbi:MAG: LL-diaminopimelate aminotransferase [Treponema sp.]|nr:LL-diaminopimelate aminotransferase [Treponema sp.]
MVHRNPCIANIKTAYLFPEIARRRREYEAAHPGAKIISLGVGNTTEPVFPHIGGALSAGALALAALETYTGYGDEQGLTALREKIAAVLYKGMIAADEVFISDGAKCDIGRLQLLFGAGTGAAVQDPSYPVYVDGSVLIGAAGGPIQRAGADSAAYRGLTYLPCAAENNYFPDLDLIPPDCLVYFCSPNNPTGVASDRKQLAALVEAARGRGSIIIFDSAYCEYIRDPRLPRSIYEIEGAKSCAIEVNSFSKSAGFTGVRLGWSVVPKDLKYASGESVNADWNRICATIFNGASNIAQAGGLAALDDEGLKEIRALTDFYLGNAKLIREALRHLGISCVGGDNSPYVWAHFPGRESWDVFSEILEKCRVLSTPGAGFGPAGRDCIRFSAFGHRADVEEACTQLGNLK